MAIAQLRIRNFRSIRSLDLQLGTVNALIGPNNAGKSNVLRALNLVLGATYPSERSFDDSDFHNYDKNQPISIEVRFRQPLNTDPQVQGFKLTLDTNGVTYLATDRGGNIAKWGPGREKRVANSMRDEVPLLYLELSRDAERQLRTTQWTLYGKLLRHLEQAITAQDRKEFSTKIGSALDAHVRPALQHVQDLMSDFIRRQSGLGIQLEFDVLDPLAVLKGVRPYFLEGGRKVDPEEVGAGLQSGLALAIANAYAKVVKQPVVLAIEEPELYLHPHGCRYFYRLLKEIAQSGVQVIYTTHERDFVDVSEYKSVNILRKPGTDTEISQGSQLSLPSSEEGLLKIWTKFNGSVNEVFFANAAILVEGFADAVACRASLGKHDPSFDLDKHGVSIIECETEYNIPAVSKVLAGFRIPTIALIDEDPGNVQTASTRAQVESQLGPGKVKVQTPNLEGLFQLKSKPSRVEALKVFDVFLKDNPVPPVYKELYNDLQKALAVT